MANKTKGPENTGKSPVRTEMADKTKKVGKLTVNIRRAITEDKGDMVETQEVEDAGQVVARYVKKDGKVLETSATPDMQLTGGHEKAAKAAGVKAEDVVFTQPALNAAESAVEVTGDEAEDKPADPLGEKAELTGKTKEVKPKSKPAQGKKPDSSMSKMANEKTGEQDKKGDRDLSKDLKKTDKIIDMAAHRGKIQSDLERTRQKSAKMLKLLEIVKKHFQGERPMAGPAGPEIGEQVRALVDKHAAKQAGTDPQTPKLGKAPVVEPFYSPEENAKDQQFEALLEEKLKRKFPPLVQAPPKLNKADDDPAEPLKRKRVEHGAQAKLQQYTPPAPKAARPNAKLAKQPRYKLLTAMESNAKTAKNEGVEGEGGQGHLSAILHLAPATLAGVGNVCEGSTEGCRDACLNTAGRGGMFKTGEATNTIQGARIRKTRYLANEPGKFMDDLIHDIHQVQRHADASKMKPVVRLNGTSDLAWEDLKLPHFQGKNIFEAFPGVQFYDYTKRPDRVMKNKHANYHLTFSRSDKNENVAKRLLAAGHNVAAVFGGKQLPGQWHGHPVVSGDEHDLRFLDPRGGHVIGLKAKGEAKSDTTGFVVWDHEGNPEKVGPKENKYNKRASVEAAANAPTEGGKSFGPLKLGKSESGEWIGKKKKEGLPTNPAQPVDKPKPAIKEGPALNYAEINKIKTQPAAGALDYSKHETPAQPPRWKQRQEAKKPKEAQPRGVVKAPAEPAPKGVVLKDKTEKSMDKMKKGVHVGNPDNAPATAQASWAGNPGTGPGPLAGDALAKDDRPHPPGSPEDSAHDVVEEGSPLKGELKQLGAPEKMSKMLAHLRTLKGGQGLRSPANQAAGKDPKPMAKTDPSAVTGAGDFGPATEPTSVTGTNAQPPLMKAAGVPPKPAKPATPMPTIPSATKTPPAPKKPTVVTAKYAVTASTGLGKSGEEWKVPGLVPPKRPERPAKPMGKSDPDEYSNTPRTKKALADEAFQDQKLKAKEELARERGPAPAPKPAAPKPMAKAAPKGVSEDKYKSCKAQVAAKQGGSEKKPYNVYAVCASALQKACGIMRNGGKLEKGDVVDLKGKKLPAAEVDAKAKAQTAKFGVNSGEFMKQSGLGPKGVVKPAPAAPQSPTKDQYGYRTGLSPEDQDWEDRKHRKGRWSPEATGTPVIQPHVQKMINTLDNAHSPGVKSKLEEFKTRHAKLKGGKTQTSGDPVDEEPKRSPEEQLRYHERNAEYHRKQAKYAAHQADRHGHSSGQEGYHEDEARMHEKAAATLRARSQIRPVK